MLIVLYFSPWDIVFIKCLKIKYLEVFFLLFN